MVLDDRFLFARARPGALGPAETLGELVTRARGDRAAIEASLDCEVSIGLLGAGDRAWRIEGSTLPWREGQRLFPRGNAEFEADSSLLRLDTPLGRASWRVYDIGLRPDAVRETFES